ncbi:putative transmembrane protein [Stappia phage SI01]|uniref:Transmembrane protein n=1 Tax=Stappia phage SI01 TaxID=2847766 RepID=A0AAE7SSG5_9CAUD|nr:putative transmembrane protein [Stappia phage SI01]
MVAIMALACSTFFAVFLKIFQQKNVIGGHKAAMAITSYGIAAFEVATITLIINVGWWAILASGTGGALACLFAIRLHDAIFKGDK